MREFPWACWPTKSNEDAFVGRRKRLPHVGSLWGRRFRLPTRIHQSRGRHEVFEERAKQFLEVIRITREEIRAE